MTIEFRKITDHFSFVSSQYQKNIFLLAISFVALSIFYLYRTIFSNPKKPLLPLLIPEKVVNLTNRNLEAIKENGYLTRILFRGSLEKQESAAQQMASDLGIPFHHFDGRKLEENHWQFNDLLDRVSSGNAPEFVFVSHADEICQTGKSVLEDILVRTGSVSKELLLCLGVSSEIQLPPDLASRYREQLIIDN